MAIYELTHDAITPAEKVDLASQGVKERQDLQRLLRTNIAVVARDIYILAEEYREWEDSKRSIDLLGLDKEANLVVIELKRTEDGPETHARNVEQELVYWGQDGNAKMPRIKKLLTDSKPVVPRSIWLNSEVGHNQEARNESLALFGDKPFTSPKPERLIKRILDIATRQGDLVLDSFAGSGTTGAVAQKMKRRWIMVEKGEHCDTHVVPRMRKVIDGRDAGGVTVVVGWSGGGGFRYYHLAPSLIETDRWGNAVISKKYNPAMLAEAMCKHLGFTYAPSSEPREYWRHGYSSERDFIFVTTASLTASALRGISEDVGSERTLLICCKAFDAKADAFENLTLKKIPQAVLTNCEWGRDDYSLSISRLPKREEEEPQPNGNGATPTKGKRKPADHLPSLFDRGD